MTNAKFWIAAALSGFVATTAVAQDVLTDTASDAVTDIEQDVRDDMKRSTAAFGNTGRKLGWDGSISARGTLSRGNSDTMDVGVGARVGYFDGLNGHRFALSYNFSKADDTTTKNEALLGYDYTREFASNAYAFGKATLTYDKFDSYETDAFIGAGMGYRVISDAKTQWSVQGGPGYRYATDNNGDAVIKQAALSASSYFSYQLSEGVSLFNDTDVLYSKKSTNVKNELGLNVAMTDSLALKTSLTSEWDSNPLGNFDAADNTLGVAVVYSFN